jgi:type III pantothenate kinase
LLQHSIRIDQPNWPESAIDWVRDHAECRQTHWRLASVHRDAVGRLDQAIARHGLDLSIRHITSKDIPIEIRVDNPLRVGIDRLLGAYAAWNRYRKAAVVIDAGSAITVDWICDEGCFQGGAILPGLRLQTQSLATGTDALPELSWQRADTPSAEFRGATRRLAPARNTADAIRLGVLTGAAAAIDRLARDYHFDLQSSRQSDANSRCENVGNIVLTGGDAEIISPHLQNCHDLVGNLVCRGLLDLPEP